MNKMIPRLTASALALCAVAACASTPKPGSPEAAALEQQEKQKATEAQVKSVIAEAPDWYVKPPQDDQKVYAPGTASSADMQLAVDESALAAKRTLADSLKGMLSGKLKQYVAESGPNPGQPDAQLSKEVENVTTDVIAEVNVSGYHQVQTKIVPEGTQYRAYVLLEYPLAQANKQLAERVGQDPDLESRLRASKAFEELERDIQNSHEQDVVPATPATPAAPATQSQ